MFGRLRGRLDRLEGEASQTMKLARDLLEDLADGVSFTLEIAGKEIPIKLRLDPREDEDK